VFLTGANGFLGKEIAAALSQQEGFCVYATMRQKPGIMPNFPIHFVDFNKDTNWLEKLTHKDVVIHTAAKQSNVASSRYKCVNVQGTLNLARQAAQSGVKRFVFLSSIKVNGSNTNLRKPFACDDIPSPADEYGSSKLEVENGLRKISSETGIEFTIIRPPLVYGPNVKGNFANLIKLVEYGIPLPLLSIKNQRSLIGVDNLVDFVVTCISHRNAVNQIFLVSDDHDLSTPKLIWGIAQAMGKPSRLFPFPKQVLAAAAKCVGKSNVADRLLGSLQVDISETKRLLSWVPPVSVQDGLSRCFPKP
jgi:nucleoside-diphosphate-sugar epimerase